ncbi:MAG: hypothetical protein VXW70_05840 [Candidatus Thermoplasmatota archaeon]|nr:hypothetical protein [Candidatus Thermoplasmatota archaeon]MEC8242911.1 hypothetical protein [Candidatus Thermoplasmatota archaeon]
MTDVGGNHEDYTNITIITIISVSILIIIYLILSGVGANISENSKTFDSKSWLVFSFRIVCFAFCAYAIIFMFRCGPANMHVVSLKDNKEILLHPIGFRKFVTFSSWTLLATTGYFLLSLINQSQPSLGFERLSWLLSLQTILFCIGVSMAFLTATVVRYIILPNMVQNNNPHTHMFLYHEQIMHNFAAVFLTLEMLIIQPDLHPQFAILGLLIGIVYVTFAYAIAYFGGGYFVYSFLHPAPKIAPLFAVGLAAGIAIFYLGIWLLSLLQDSYGWLSIILSTLWVSMIVQFKPNTIT